MGLHKKVADVYAKGGNTRELGQLLHSFSVFDATIQQMRLRTEELKKPTTGHCGTTEWRLTELENQLKAYLESEELGLFTEANTFFYNEQKSAVLPEIEALKSRILIDVLQRTV